MKKHLATKNTFEKYLKKCEQYLEQYKQIQPPKETPIPEFTEGEKWTGYAWIEKEEIKERNKRKISTYESLKEEIKEGKKNLETLTSKEGRLFVLYDSIPTINGGEINIKEYAEYLKEGLNSVKRELDVEENFKIIEISQEELDKSYKKFLHNLKKIKDY